MPNVYFVRSPSGEMIVQPQEAQLDWFDLDAYRNVQDGTVAVCNDGVADRVFAVVQAGKWIEPEPPLGDQQAEAYDAILSGVNTFVTGPGGVGKSEVTRRAVRDLRARNRTIAVTASTGIAAVNVGGTTIHSLLGTGLARSTRELQMHHSSQQLDKASDRLGRVDAILIDEVSMLLGDFLDMTDWWLRKCAMQLGRVQRVNQPFGGWQMIFVGDFLQLPPVVRSGDEASIVSRYAFQSKAWNDANPRVNYLRTGYRQNDAEHRKHLMRVRRGYAPQDTIDFFNARFKAKIPVEPTVVFPTNREADTVNEMRLYALPEPHKVYEASYTGHDGWIEALKKNMPCDPSLELRIGAEVLFIRNNIKVGFVNGTRARVVALDDDHISVETPDGRLIDVPIETWEMKDAQGRVLAAVLQYPLILGWAVTVHRCQGQSLDYMRFDPAKVFERAQSYVALSRVRTMDGLTLANRITPESIKASAKCVDYYDNVIAAEKANAATG